MQMSRYSSRVMELRPTWDNSPPGNVMAQAGSGSQLGQRYAVDGIMSLVITDRL